MRRTFIKIISTLLFVVIVLAIIAFNAALVWVATGPRTLAFAIPYIEQALNTEGSAYRFHIGEGVMMWDGWKHPLDLRLKQVDVLTQDGVRFAAFPDISMELDLLALAMGRLEPAGLVFHKPIISLFQDEEGKVSFGMGGETSMKTEDKPLIPVLLAAFAPGHKGLMGSLRSVEIEEADISVGNAWQGVVLHANHVNFGIRRSWRRGSMLHFSLALAQEGKTPALISAEAYMPRGERQVHASLYVKELWPTSLAPLTPWPVEQIVNALRLPFSGELTVTYDEKGIRQDMVFSLRGGKGEVATKHLVGPLPVESIAIQGKSAEGNGIALEALNVDFGGPLLQAKGSYTPVEDDAKLTLDAQLQGANASHIAAFWPPDLAKESRAWVVNNITAGTIPKVDVKADVLMSDFAKPFLPQEAVHATIDFSKTVLKFFPTQPPLTDAEGVVHVDAKALSVDTRSARFLSGTQLSNSHAVIEDLNQDNPRIDVRFHAEAPAADIARFLSEEPVKKAERLQLKPEAVQGAASGDVALSFYFTAPRDANGKPVADMGVTYDVKGNITNVTQAGFLGKFDLSAMNGAVAIDNQGIAVKGEGDVNGAHAKGDVRYLFTAEKGFDTFIKVLAHAPVSALKRFGYPELFFLSGMLDGTVDYKQGEGGEQVALALDLKNTILNWQDMRWQKPAGRPGSFSVNMERKADGLALSDMKLLCDNTEVKGALMLGGDMSQVTKVNLNRFKLGESDLSVLEYEVVPGGYRIKAQGAAADSSPWTASGSGEKTFSFKKFPALDLIIDVKKLVMKPGRELHNVAGSMHCNAEFCQDADIAGEAGKPFHFRISQSAGPGRSVFLQAEDAGALLNGSGVYDNMRGGSLGLDAVFDDTKPERLLAGTLNIRDFTIINAPVLAKMLTLSSLTSIVDTLRGSGISFVKCEAPFTLEKDVITLKEAHMHGPAMGLSAEGTITFPAQANDLKGTIVPSYTINSALGKVPLVGDMLTGGGEGVFGARYSLKGSLDEPDLSVNPLSLLTPGFLRGIFDIFDSPAETPNTKSQENSGGAASSSSSGEAQKQWPSKRK